MKQHEQLTLQSIGENKKEIKFKDNQRVVLKLKK